MSGLLLAILGRIIVVGLYLLSPMCVYWVSLLPAGWWTYVLWALSLSPLVLAGYLEPMLDNLEK